MLRIFYGFAVILLVVSCKKKEKTVEVEKDVIVYQDPVYDWKKVKDFESSQAEYIKNAGRAGQGFIYFVGLDNNMVYDSVHNSFPDQVGQVRDMQLKPLLTDAYRLELYDDWLNIVPHNNLPGYPFTYSGQQIFMKNLDSLFESFFLQGPLFAGEVIGNNNTLLFAYNARGSSNPICVGIKLKFTTQPMNIGASYTEIEKMKTIKCSSTWFASDGFIGPVGNNLLFVMGYGRNYALNSNLDTVFINNTYSFADLFKYKQTYFSIAQKNSDVCLITTNDEGLTWREVFCGLNYDFMHYNFEQVGDKLIAYISNQLWEITITDNTLIKKELSNDGLANKRIKAINMCNNRVFISTESGVFERPYTEFIEYK